MKKIKKFIYHSILGGICIVMSASIMLKCNIDILSVPAILIYIIEIAMYTIGIDLGTKL